MSASVMVDVDIPYGPPSPLEDSVLGSPLCSPSPLEDSMLDSPLCSPSPLDHCALHSPLCSPSPLGHSVLDSPLCGHDGFIGGMEGLQARSKSMDDDAFSSLGAHEYPSSSTGSGSEGSTALGEEGPGGD